MGRTGVAGIQTVDVTPEWSTVIWKWIQDNPMASLDDHGPHSHDACAKVIHERIAHERLFGFVSDSEPIGIIGVCPVTDRTAILHGVLFDRSVLGTGLPQSALCFVLERLWSEGIVKVSAAYFADNQRVRKFLTRLGAVDEGYLRAQTMREGKPIDQYLVAFFRE